MKTIISLIIGCGFCFQMSAQVIFTLSSSPSVGPNPAWVTAADVNGDGSPDLISASSGANTLSVLTNDGSGGFVLASSPVVGNDPVSVAVADLNNDGKLELVCGNYSDSTISVLTNNGGGVYVQSTAVSVGGQPESVIATDVNGDGKLDLVCCIYNNGNGSTLSVLTNNGAGGFVLASTPTVGTGPVSVVAADINGDGKVDLVCANIWSSTVSILTNNGAGNFGLKASVGVGSQPYWVTAADVDGDGKVDLVTANRGNSTLTVLTNDGSGNFTISTNLNVGNAPQSVVAADVNGDGALDLISANSSGNSLSVLTNDGSGNFTLVTTLGVTNYPVMVTATDVNGDGKPDLISANYGTTTVTVFTNGTVFPNTPPTITTQPVSQTNVAGATVAFSVQATGSFPLFYQWQFDGTNLLAATNSTLTLSNLSTNQTGIYDVIVTNAYGSVTSNPAMLDVLFLLVEVNGQPAFGTVTDIAPATVTILGGYSGGYLFYTLDGSTPTTSSTLYTGPFVLTNSAIVSVLALSSDFSQQTQGTPVTVQIIPTFTLQTSVIGSGTLSANPPGGVYASNSVVALTATPALHWSFAYWAGNASGSQNPLSITMNGSSNIQAVFVPSAYPLTLTTPGGGTVTANGVTIGASTYYPTDSVVTLAATPASGWVFLGWQGTISGTNNPLRLVITQTNNIQGIFGTVAATNAAGGAVVLSVPNPVPYGTALTVSAVPNPGNYFVNWTGNLGGIYSPMRYTVFAANPTFGALFTPLPAGKFSLAVVVNGPGFVNYSPQSSYYSSNQTVSLTATPNSGAYFFGWTQGATGRNSPLSIQVTSNTVIQANFGVAPTVSISPLNQTVFAGSNAVITASAMGLPPLTNQWFNNQGIIPGATNTIYTISNTQPTNAGSYWVVVSSSVGSVTSAVATVTVISTPSITNEPASATVTVGHAASFVVGAYGAPTLAYQWQLNGANLQAATNAALTVSNAFPANAGAYTVTVTNAYGSVTSSPAAWLTVLPLDIIVPNRLANGQFQFTFDTALGINYEVESSTNLLNWYVWLTLGGNGQPLTLSDPNTTGSPQRYYRVLLSPQ